MARVKRGTKRHNKRAKVLGLAKGYWGAKGSNYRTAKEAVEKSLLYAYRDRRAKKRDFRGLWIIRVKAGAMANGLTYSRFIQGLKKMKCDLDRKVLAEMAVNAPEAFGRVVAQAKDALA
ncbi:MAG: 50S ribosomal protein L20 [Candidatus Aminicenantes bacterium]|nr:50S ribosomal protein L20 [Candidatus Aminicenantes bacterium]